VRPVIIDTDMGQDDLMALAWLLRDPSLEILAVTVSGTGLAHCDPGVDNLRAVIALMDAAGPEVGCGPEITLGGGTPFPDEWRAFADQLGGVSLPTAPDAGAPSRPAAEIVGDQLRTQAEPVTILTLGPLTTLATTLAADPMSVADIAEVVAMGGALDVPGNVILDGASTLGASEWNLHADPVAATMVLASGVPITFVALDATQDAPMTTQIAASLASDHTATGAWLANELIQRDPFLVSGEWFLWDPLAAAALIDPTLVTPVDERLSVTESGPDAGALVRDDAGHDARVATSADGARFTDAFLAGLRIPSG
jgi:inosine-uridine nucleoside N-ribohydrolase